MHSQSTAAQEEPKYSANKSNKHFIEPTVRFYNEYKNPKIISRVRSNTTFHENFEEEFVPIEIHN